MEISLQKLWMSNGETWITMYVPEFSESTRLEERLLGLFFLLSWQLLRRESINLFQIPFLRNFISNREFGSTTRDSIA
jgi:hypothetical protein